MYEGLWCHIHNHNHNHTHQPYYKLFGPNLQIIHPKYYLLKITLRVNTSSEHPEDLNLVHGFTNSIFANLSKTGSLWLTSKPTDKCQRCWWHHEWKFSFKGLQLNSFYTMVFTEYGIFVEYGFNYVQVPFLSFHRKKLFIHEGKNCWHTA